MLISVWWITPFVLAIVLLIRDIKKEIWLRTLIAEREALANERIQKAHLEHCGYVKWINEIRIDAINKYLTDLSRHLQISGLEWPRREEEKK